MTPGVEKVRVKLQCAGALDGAPSPPWSAQPLAQRNVPSSSVTLWLPPLFVQVTDSPALIVTLRGEKLTPDNGLVRGTSGIGEAREREERGEQGDEVRTA